MIYFDFAATTPLDEEAANIYIKTATEIYGNANSLHDIGSEASGLVENCRKELADLLGIDKNGLFFTSGGSESNFLAIHALLSAALKNGSHIITGTAEHSSIHGVMKRLEGIGYRVTYLPLDEQGIIDCGKLLEVIESETVLVAIQQINSEIGTIQPINEIARICKEQNILFHSDFVQSFGKIDVKEVAPLVSSFSFSGHKIYGPKGIGGVYLNPRLFWKPFFPEGTHERGFRPGTLNVPAIAAMTLAAKKICTRPSEDWEQSRTLRQVFIQQLEPIKDYVKIHEAEGDNQLPSIIGLRVLGMEGQLLMLECNRHGFAISTGSACHVGMQAPSNTMHALGIPAAEAKGFIRISFGHSTTIEEVQQLGQTITKLVKSSHPIDF